MSEALTAVYYTLKGISLISHLSKQGKQPAWQIRIFIWIWFYPSIILIRVIPVENSASSWTWAHLATKINALWDVIFPQNSHSLTTFPHPTTSIQHYRWLRPTTFFTRDHTLA